MLLIRETEADPVRVLYPQGSSHGFVEITTVGGIRIGVGDFLQPVDVAIDARQSLIPTVGPAGEISRVRFRMPSDTYNGLASTILMNVSPSTPETRIAVVIPGDKPRIVHLSMKNAGEVPITLAGTPRKATDFAVHVELGGVTGVVAPLIGKQPSDYHVLILTGADPAFIREEGQLYEGGPVWRIQQVSAAFPP